MVDNLYNLERRPNQNHDFQGHVLQE